MHTKTSERGEFIDEYKEIFANNNMIFDEFHMCEGYKKVDDIMCVYESMCNRYIFTCEPSCKCRRYRLLQSPRKKYTMEYICPLSTYETIKDFRVSPTMQMVSLNRAFAMYKGPVFEAFVKVAMSMKDVKTGELDVDFAFETDHAIFGSLFFDQIGRLKRSRPRSNKLKS